MPFKIVSTPVMAKQETTKTDIWRLLVIVWRGVYGTLGYIFNFLTGFQFVPDTTNQKNRIEFKTEKLMARPRCAFIIKDNDICLI